MKDKYNFSVTLRCSSCGDSSFDFSPDKTWAKCQRCAREFPGGRAELIQLNQLAIESHKDQVKKEITEDAKKEFNRMLKKTFGKNTKFK